MHCQDLQVDVNRVCDWIVDNKMSLNVKKSSVKTITRKTNHIEFIYNINNKQIDRNNEPRDLGMLF